MAQSFSPDDLRYMRRALQLAARGRGAVEPNPMVGCVLVRRGRVVGEGYHHAYGGPHAEVEALRRAQAAARGATAYVTLEPCSHHGKTPPCADALIAAGVAEVVAAMKDPFPEVAGRGFRKLRRAGIAVRSGLEADSAAELNAPFLTRLLLNRPYVIAKWAQSLDGKTATRTGKSKWITGPEARRFAHRVRARVDAILVGIGTVLADDPTLVARDVPCRRIAARVVFDNSLRLPVTSRLVRSIDKSPLIVVTTAAALVQHKRRALALANCGASVVKCRSRDGRVDVSDALRRFAKRGWTNVLVEGGGTLVGAFRDAGVIDEAHVYTAPMIIGGEAAPTGCGGAGAVAMSGVSAPRWIRRRVLGDDQFVCARLTATPLGS